MSSFQDSYARVVDNMGGISGTAESTEYVGNVKSAIDTCVNALKQEAEHRVNVSDDYLKGWLAEPWHAETLNISAAARGRGDVSAHVPGNNGAHDIRYGGGGTWMEAQVKYDRTAEATAKDISHPKYGGMEKIVPQDQLKGVIDKAHNEALRNQNTRPEQAAEYKHTAEHASDHLKVGNAESKPLSEPGARELAKDLRKDGDLDADKFGLNAENFVEWSDVARQASQAALHAAVMAAALRAAPHIWAVSREYLESGQIDSQDLIERGQEILSGAGMAGLRGGVAAALSVSCQTGLMGQACKSVSPWAIGMATTLTMNAIGYSFQLQQGHITNRDFAHHCIRDTWALSAGMLGATAGQLMIPIPVLGALAGNLVGSTLGAVAFEGTNQAILGICVESGWTFFGLVSQDYTVPEDVLLEAGYDLSSTQSFSLQTFSTGGFQVQSFETNSLNFTPIRRGVLSATSIGYLK